MSHGKLLRDDSEQLVIAELVHAKLTELRPLANQDYSAEILEEGIDQAARKVTEARVRILEAWKRATDEAK